MSSLQSPSMFSILLLLHPYFLCSCYCIHIFPYIPICFLTYSMFIFLHWYDHIHLFYDHISYVHILHVDISVLKSSHSHFLHSNFRHNVFAFIAFLSDSYDPLLCNPDTFERTRMHTSDVMTISSQRIRKKNWTHFASDVFTTSISRVHEHNAHTHWMLGNPPESRNPSVPTELIDLVPWQPGVERVVSLVGLFCEGLVQQMLVIAVFQGLRTITNE